MAAGAWCTPHPGAGPSNGEVRVTHPSCVTYVPSNRVSEMPQAVRKLLSYLNLDREASAYGGSISFCYRNTFNARWF